MQRPDGNAHGGPSPTSDLAAMPPDAFLLGGASRGRLLREPQKDAAFAIQRDLVGASRRPTIADGTYADHGKGPVGNFPFIVVTGAPWKVATRRGQAQGDLNRPSPPPRSPAVGRAVCGYAIVPWLRCPSCSEWSAPRHWEPGTNPKDPHAVRCPACGKWYDPSDQTMRIGERPTRDTS